MLWRANCAVRKPPAGDRGARSGRTMAMFGHRNGGQWQGRPAFLLIGVITGNEPYLLSGPKGVIRMAGMLKVSRSRGALSGVLLLLLGIWGGLIPLVGPYVHYVHDHAWRITSGRIWLRSPWPLGAVLGGSSCWSAGSGRCRSEVSGERAWFAWAARWHRSGRRHCPRRAGRWAASSPGRWSRSASSPASAS